MISDNKFIVPSLILAIFFVLGVLIISEAWRNHTRTNQTITVTGSAKKLIVSDLGILRVTITASEYSQQEAFRSLSRQIPVLKNFISKYGIHPDSIDEKAPTGYPVYEVSPTGYQTTKVIGYVYSQNIDLMSRDVELIKKLSMDISKLVEQGVNFQQITPEYHYTKLSELKIEIQAEAAKDAMMRAKKIAESTGSKLGNLRNARMGVLQITPKFSNMISDYGINDLSSIEKEITAVVNASFEIK
ncbi:MAG: SIMPL domain-containing protein [Ignavibacteria bacterium]|nr:SIMPL domain-containing protein [Ignavibacteria bacterium]